MKLKDRIALVTGSSRGIGEGIARRLARDGAKIILHAHANRAKAEKIAQDIAGAGGTAHIVTGDLETGDAPVRIVQDAFKIHGALDILVCNAGISGGVPVKTLDLAHIDRVLSVNLRAVMLSVAEFARLTKSAHGRAVVISSGSAIHAAAGSPAYAAAKAGAEAFARSAAQELGPRGITVNSVAPGPTVNGFLDENNLPPWAEVAARWTPLKRLGRPDDIADIVAFVVSDEARWVTGVTIAANGGLFTTASNAVIHGLPRAGES